VSAFYILAMAFLGLHLFHGAWSSLRTLGVAHPSEHPMKRRISAAIAIIVWLGFTLVPLGVLAGIVH
jgi:succinate dehydrogenase / fumarate reductase cytochrome b subunit